MFTDFFVLCGITVPENYTWDLGTPLQTVATTRTANSTVSSISGYAPALDVVFGNNSVSDTGYDFIDFTWNFGDYYHDTNNSISLSCASLVRHTFIMPGIYTVSLRHTQSKGRVELDQTGNSLLCRGKYGIRWFWDELSLLNVVTSAANPNATTWDETACDAIKAKWWDDEEACFQKYCKAWSWYDLTTGRSNPVKWSDTESDQLLQKKWAFEANDTICTVGDADFLSTTETIEQNVIKQFIVEVKEIPPTAGMHSVSAAFGTSPFTVQLTPRNCKPGSFPIDRIDWDFGDGSPVKTVTRYSLPSSTDIVNSGYFAADPSDVRNIDVLHTYIRNKESYPVFYPSLTCYSSCTNTSDSCCIAIGPISLPVVPTELHLLKARNTIKGNVYTFAENNNIALATTTQLVTSIIGQVTVPPTTMRDTRGQFLPYFGYANVNEFPAFYTPDCSNFAALLPEDYITTEDDTPDQFTSVVPFSGEGIPVTTETDLFIIP